MSAKCSFSITRQRERTYVAFCIYTAYTDAAAVSTHTVFRLVNSPKVQSVSFFPLLRYLYILLLLIYVCVCVCVCEYV
jgi:hypothetical protein